MSRDWQRTLVVVCVVVLAVGGVAAVAQAAPASVPPAPDLTSSVQIKASDEPMQMPAVQAFLSPRPADRLNSRWPENL